MLRKLFLHEGQVSVGLPSAPAMPARVFRSCCSRAPTYSACSRSRSCIAAACCSDSASRASSETLRPWRCSCTYSRYSTVICDMLNSLLKFDSVNQCISVHRGRGANQIDLV